MSNTKEKLFELVGQVQDCGCDVTDVVEMNYVENNVLVDHLIANNVTIQVRGHWIKECKNRLKCSICSLGRNTDVERELNFCPRCGAQMYEEIAYD